MADEAQSLKETIAKNLTELRRKNSMTQAELAEQLNYTDKAVSKWERAESIPDVVVLKQIATLFGVTVDYLLTAEHDENAPSGIIPKKPSKRAHVLITCISILLVWLVATAVFVMISISPAEVEHHWLAFIYALPLAAIVYLVLNSIWFNQKVNYLIISFLMWSILLSAHLSALVIFNYSMPLIYLLGAPGQVIILLWSKIRKNKKK